MLQSQKQQVILGVTALFWDRARWTQRSDARNINGMGVDPLADRAVAWCLQGGIRLVAHRLLGDGSNHADLAGSVHRHVEYYVRKHGYKSIPECNDKAGLDLVRQVLHDSLGGLVSTQGEVDSASLRHEGIGDIVAKIIADASLAASTTASDGPAAQSELESV